MALLLVRPAQRKRCAYEEVVAWLGLVNDAAPGCVDKSACRWPLQIHIVGWVAELDAAPDGNAQVK